MTRACLLAGLAPLCLSLPAYAAAKRVAQVGSCEVNMTQFTTIGAALAAVPSGATIYVCPGVYPEQLTISKSVTLLGATDSTSSAPTIVPPAGGLTGNYTPTGSTVPYAPQIAAIGAGTVKIANLTVDGTNNQINGCGPILIGILFESTSGSISGNQVVNQSLTPQSSLGGCQSGNAIVAESIDSNNYTVTISGNQVTNFQKNGVTADGPALTFTISGNTVVGEGATSLIAQNGIQAGPGGGGKVTGNLVSDNVYTGSTYGATGILVYDSPSVTVSANTASNTQGGVYVYEDGSYTADAPVISKNIVTTTHTYDGIDVCGVAGGSITGNTINGSDESAVHVDGECSSPSTNVAVNGNKVNGACVGVLEGPGTSVAAMMFSNTLLNTITQVQTGSDTCTVTTPQVAARLHGHAQGARRPSPRL